MEMISCRVRGAEPPCKGPAPALKFRVRNRIEAIRTNFIIAATAVDSCRAFVPALQARASGSRIRLARLTVTGSQSLAHGHSPGPPLTSHYGAARAARQP